MRRLKKRLPKSQSLPYLEVGVDYDAKASTSTTTSSTSFTTASTSQGHLIAFPQNHLQGPPNLVPRHTKHLRRPRVILCSVICVWFLSALYFKKRKSLQVVLVVSTRSTGENPNLTTTDYQSNTVIGMMITGSKDINMYHSYDEDIYKHFVGSLRNTGFRGNIIVPVTSQTPYHVISYLTSQNVTLNHVFDCVSSDKATLRTSRNDCLQEYSNVPAPLIPYLVARKCWKECETCQKEGHVILASIPHVRFIRDPFQIPSSVITHDFNLNGLHLFETMQLEMTNARVETILHTCMTTPHVHWSVPMLSTRMIMGDTQSIRFYLDNMISTMNQWSRNQDCPCDVHMLPLAILNYLYYNGNIYARVHSTKFWKIKKKPLIVQFLSSDFNKGVSIWQDNFSITSSSPSTSVLVIEDL